MDLAGLGGVAAILRLAKKVAIYVSRLSDLERAPQEINEFKISCSNFGNVLNGFYRVSDKCVKKEEQGGEKIWSEQIAGFVLQGRQVADEMRGLLERLEGSDGKGMKWMENFLWTVFRKEPVKHLKLNMNSACMHMQSFVAIFTLDELQLQWLQCNCAKEKRRLKEEIASLKRQIETQSVVAEQSAYDLKEMNKRLSFNEQEQKENRIIRQGERGLDKSLQRRLKKNGSRSEVTSRPSASNQSSELSHLPRQIEHQQIRITRKAEPQPRWHDADVDGFANELERDPYRGGEGLQPGSNPRHDIGTHIGTELARNHEGIRGTRIRGQGNISLWPPASATNNGFDAVIDEFAEDTKDIADDMKGIIELGNLLPGQFVKLARRGGTAQVGSRVIDDGAGPLRVEHGQWHGSIQKGDDQEKDSDEEVMNRLAHSQKARPRQLEVRNPGGNGHLPGDTVRNIESVSLNPRDQNNLKSARQLTTRHNAGQALGLQAGGSARNRQDRKCSTRPKEGDDMVASCDANHKGFLPSEVPLNSKKPSHLETNEALPPEKGRRDRSTSRSVRVLPTEEKLRPAHESNVAEARAHVQNADYKRRKNLKPMVEKRRRDGQGVVTGDPEEDDEFERRKRWGRRK